MVHRLSIRLGEAFVDEVLDFFELFFRESLILVLADEALDGVDHIRVRFEFFLGGIALDPQGRGPGFEAFVLEFDIAGEIN